MKIDLHISQSEAGKFRTSCEAAIVGVGAATKAATIEALATIMTDSLEQVPVDTGTLISSQYCGVSRRVDLKTYRYGGVIGYGRPEGLAETVGLNGIDWLAEPTNPVNPKSGFEASTYAATVHENLEMAHPRGGKAKFLEDPVRNYAANNFVRTVTNYWRTQLITMEHNGIGNAWRDPETGKIYSNPNAIISKAKRNRLQRIQKGHTIFTTRQQKYIATRTVTRKGDVYHKNPTPKDDF